jgi:hypothetical protein
MMTGASPKGRRSALSKLAWAPWPTVLALKTAGTPCSSDNALSCVNRLVKAVTIASPITPDGPRLRRPPQLHCRC